MLACTKGKVRIGQTVQVQMVWVSELSRIPVCCSKHEHNSLPLAQANAADFHLVFGDSANELNWAFITQQFLHCAADKFRVLLQHGHFFRVPQERVHSIADQVSSGLVSGAKQHYTLCEELLFRQNLTVLLDIEQQADEIAAFVAAPLRHSSSEKLLERQDCLLCEVGLLHGPIRVAQKHRDRIRPANEPLVQKLRHSKHPRNDAHRQRMGNLPQDVCF